MPIAICHQQLLLLLSLSFAIIFNKLQPQLFCLHLHEIPQALITHTFKIPSKFQYKLPSYPFWFDVLFSNLATINYFFSIYEATFPQITIILNNLVFSILQQ